MASSDGPAGITTKDSPRSVPDTVERLLGDDRRSARKSAGRMPTIAAIQPMPAVAMVGAAPRPTSGYGDFAYHGPASGVALTRPIVGGAD